MIKLLKYILDDLLISQSKYLVILFLYPQIFAMNGQSTEPVLKIHYLGHSAFVLEFDNGISIVTDYGESNAWIQWGWDSPIEEIGTLLPDVMTYSHTHHKDHYDYTRIPKFVSHILTEYDSLVIDDIEIKPIRVCENNTDDVDNSAYLFIYKGMKFLHLGDAQAQIISIENEIVKNHINKIIPDSLDLLFMTIDGKSQFAVQAELFIDLLKPRRVIPMHYWTLGYKNEFLLSLTEQNKAGKHYSIINSKGPKYEIYQAQVSEPVKVINLTRSAYYKTTSSR